MVAQILTLSSPDSGDVTAFFPESIKLEPDSEYELALHSATLWYSWSNIAQEYGNHLITYSNGIDPPKNVQYPTGNYSVGDLQTYLHKIMKENGDYTTVDGKDIFDINLLVNYSTIQVTIELTNGYTLELSNSSFGLLIGFPAIDLTATTTSTLTPDITRGVDSIYLLCDIITGSYNNGVRSNVLYSFVPNTSVGSAITISPRNLIYLKIDVQQITQIKINVVDQLLRPVNFRGEGASYMMSLRRSR